MNEKEYFIDDRVIIPDDIRNMTKEELQLEISRLEAEAATAKKRLLESKKTQNVNRLA
ncbi:hypothetical protein [Ruminococcus champanellensis]